MSQNQNQSQQQPVNMQPYTPQGYYGMQSGYGAYQYPYGQMPRMDQLGQMQMAQNGPQQQQQPPVSDVPGMLPAEESYIENILRLNKGKKATVYMTFENNDRWNAKVFKGTIEAAGRDHIILSDTETGKRYVLLMVYLDYITFDEEINYDYPYNQSPGMTSYSPR
ncbi:spore germination protein Q [Gracilibacillus orientalis]|uniref:Spore germination protein Q n=1 Tax=Gracilibacillus orientalis TaxID=334253 RepID=A0A1I4NQS2_9BACI|nr:spore coat protein GerQ [Gracilibacillus orientalis]SFM17705.1 spore germination protein Q [Gracilibacillus orientalis]